MGEGEEPRLARRQQLLQRELGARVEVQRAAPRRRCRWRRWRRRGGAPRCPGQVCERRGVGLEEVPSREPGAQRGLEAVAGEKERAARLVARGGPPGVGHGRDPLARFGRDALGALAMRPGSRGSRRGSRRPRGAAAIAAKDHLRESHRLLAPQGQRARDRRQALCRADRLELPPRQGHAHDLGRPAPPARTASRCRERWRTVEQVERVNVDEREYDFLYEDGEGFHFMEPETFDQITVGAGHDRRRQGLPPGGHARLPQDLRGRRGGDRVPRRRSPSRSSRPSRW